MEFHNTDFHPMLVQSKPVVAMYYNTKKQKTEETHNILPRWHHPKLQETQSPTCLEMVALAPCFQPKYPPKPPRQELQLVYMLLKLTKWHHVSSVDLYVSLFCFFHIWAHSYRWHALGEILSICETGWNFSLEWWTPAILWVEQKKHSRRVLFFFLFFIFYFLPL